jgi:phenylalanyl-tRNA synthetase beta chain
LNTPRSHDGEPAAGAENRRRYFLSDIPLDEARRRFYDALEQADSLSPMPGETVSLDQALGAPQEARGYRPIPRFPGVKLDVAVLTSQDTFAGDVQALIEKAGKGLVRDLELFDLYRGESLGEGRKSLAYHLQLQSDKRTLSDKDCAKFLDRLERGLGEAGAELRRS